MKKQIEKLGVSYVLTKWMIDSTGLKDVGEVFLNFVRGSKRGEDEIDRVNGVIHEDLLEVMILDLKYKSKLVPSKFTHATIEKLRDALMFQRLRQAVRKGKEINGTYSRDDGELDLSEYDFEVKNPVLSFVFNGEKSKIRKFLFNGKEIFLKVIEGDNNSFRIECEFEMEADKIREDLSIEFLDEIDLSSFRLEKGGIVLK